MDGSRSLKALMAEMYTVRMSDVWTPEVGGDRTTQKYKYFSEIAMYSTLIHDYYQMQSRQYVYVST